MNFLRWIALHRKIYSAISALLVLLLASLVVWQTNRINDSDRELHLAKELGILASTIEGGTINSQTMGAAILLGLEHREVKKLALGKLPPDAPSVLSGMEAIRRQFIASAVFLINTQGVIVAYSDGGNKSQAGRDMSSWPYVQLSLQGTPNVYPAMGAAANDRGIYLAVPVRATNDNKSRSIGALVVKVGTGKLDMVLDSWTEGIALLLSPTGKVFSASHRDWIFRKTGEISASRIDGIQLAGQPGKVFVQPRLPQLPFSLDTPEINIEGTHYSVNDIPLEWHDPEGVWRLVGLARRPHWWSSWNVPVLSGLTGLAVTLGLFWLFSLARHEYELFKSDALLRESQNIAALGGYVLNLQTGLFSVSEETYKLCGIDKNYDHSTAGWMALIHPDDREMVDHYFHNKVLGQGKHFDKEYRIQRHNDHAERWVHGLGRLEFDTQGRPVKMHGTVQDITERKQSEEALHESEANLHAILDNSPYLTWLKDTEGRYITINKVFADFLHLEEPHLAAGKTDLDLQPKELAEKYRADDAEVMASIKSKHVEESAFDGNKTIWVETFKTPIVDKHGQVLGTVGFARDITERKQAELELEISEARYRTLFEQTADYVLVLEPSYAGPLIIIDANEAAFRKFGYSRSEMIGKPVTFLDREAASKELVSERLRLLKTEKLVHFEVEHVCKDGSTFWADVAIKCATIGGQDLFYTVERDITERKVIELELTESMLRLEEKELAKSRFLAAAGHDLRQPLAAANLYIEALKFTELTPQQQNTIRQLNQSMTTFGGLLDSLLNISKLDSGIIKPDFSPLNLAEVFDWLEQTFALMTSEKHIGFKLYFPARETLVVRSDFGLLKSSLMNIISNAIKYTSKGAILVSARRRGSDVLFQVWDTGIGIGSDHLEHIFDEFYQINNPQRDRTSGLGLGLAIARRTISLLGSDIGCRSQIGRGSVFEFRLPLEITPDVAAQQDATAAPQENAANDPFARGKRFVVVEDDALVAKAMTAWLEAMGGEVKCFHKAEDALLHTNNEHHDYFIVDYMLGGKINGIQFLNLLRQKLGKPINAVLVTGDTSSNFIREAVNCDWPVIHKPFNTEKLISCLKIQEGRRA
jgi:PAS domain S-box-containing protein